MLGATIVSLLRGAARRFIGADQGNIAVIFAIAAVPIISFVGAAIDYTRANSARSAMQAALDSTALMLSKDLAEGLITPAQVNAKAATYFAGLYTNPDGKPTATVNATYTASSSIGSSIVVNGSAVVTTNFMKVAGFPQLNIGTSSTAAWGNVRMRVAMALDVTGSMSADGKMPALQTATKSLIDQLSALAKSPGDIYISIVPFAKDINMGASNYNQPWINWSAWEAANPDLGTCSKNKDTKSSCEQSNGVWSPDHSKWTGCLTDRDQDFDTKNTTPTLSNSATLFPAEEYTSWGWSGIENYCKVGNVPYLPPVMPLSYNWSALKTLVDSLQPTGNTNQGIGLAWAWMTLGTGAPFNAPAKDPNYTYKDAIILVSDGLNTQNRWYSNAAQIDTRQRILCDNAKAAGITIYTMHINTGSPADTMSAVLQYCASGTDKFYHITSASQTVAAFSSIGSSLSKLRVAR